MIKRSISFFKSIQALIGAIIGVGIFGIPYAMAQAGFAIGLAHIIILGAVNLVMVLAYVELVLYDGGNNRLVGSMKEHLGEHWGFVMATVLFGSIWGAMLAYMIIGGEFLHVLINPILGGGLTFYQYIFFIICSFFLLGGLGMVARLELFFVTALLFLLGLIVIGAAPYADLSLLTHINLQHAFLPFGVVLFAFGGLGVVPEMKAILGRNTALLRRAAVIGFVVITLVYAVFAGVVVSVTGLKTTPEAILGLGSVLGQWAIILGAGIGLISVATSFLILGVEVMNTTIFDYKRRFLTGWGMAIAVPFILFFFGARDFIEVIGFTGGVLAALVGLLLIFSYFRAKKSAHLPKRTLTIPNWLMYICVLVLTFGMLITIVGIFEAV